MDKHPMTHAFLSSTPLRTWGMKSRTGEVGIEIETEGANLPDIIQYHWDAKTDGSLRDRHGQSYEYVLRNPVAREKVPEVLRYLNKKFTEAGAVPDYTYRTSVHVHLNAQTMTLRETLTWLCVYFVVEDLITQYCGPHRVGNRFCLRASDAEGIVGNIVQTLIEGNVGRMTNVAWRYAACNTSALPNFGSVEFRAMRGTNDEQTLTRWVELLLSIKDASAAFKSPKDVVEAFSTLGPRVFLQRVVPDWFFQEYQWHPDRDTSMWDGVRRIMDVAYCGLNWDYKQEVAPTTYYDPQPQVELAHDPLEVAFENIRRDEEEERLRRVQDPLIDMGRMRWAEIPVGVRDNRIRIAPARLGAPPAPAPRPPLHDRHANHIIRDEF